jgi:hypothetical protein
MPALTMADLRSHLRELERVTMAHEGNRGHGTVAYSEAAEYIASGWRLSATRSPSRSTTGSANTA